MIKKLLVECLGTALLTLFGCGVAVVTGADSVATSLAFGFVLIVLIYSFGSISGGHFNPAVSLAMAIEKKISWKEFLYYVLSQIVGAFFGSVVLGLLLNSFKHLGANQVQYFVFETTKNNNAHAYTIGLLAELVLTFVFVLSILVITKDDSNKHTAGILIGLSLALVHLLGLAFTGTSVNPARSIAPAVVQAIAGNTEAIKQIWIFILGPICGSALAAFTFEGLFCEKTENKDSSKEVEE